MSIVRPEFLLGLLIFWPAYCVLPGPRSRRAAFASANVAVLAFFMPHVASWAVVAGFLASGYAAGRLLARRPSRWGLAAYFAALAAALVYLNRYTVLARVLPDSLARHPIVIVGLSYMFFRQTRFVVDCMQGQIRACSLAGYLNYQLNLFALLAGPLQRYNDFQAYWLRPVPIRRPADEALLAWLRMLVGFAKVAVVGAGCLWAYNHAFGRLALAAGGQAVPRWGTIGWFVVLFYAAPAYVYMNFSGYCDVAIGGASLLGLRLPENFHCPFLSRNMLDFWTRWHRTLGFWVRDFLFTPMYKAVAERRGGSAPGWATPLYFVAFFLICVWHGTTRNFVVFGLLQGLGVSVAKAWEGRILRRGGRDALIRYLASRRIRVIATVATGQFASMTCLFFLADLDTCLVPIVALLDALAGA